MCLGPFIFLQHMAIYRRITRRTIAFAEGFRAFGIDEWMMNRGPALRLPRRLLLIFVIAMAAVSGPLAPHLWAQDKPAAQTKRGQSGLQIPRFVSLKSNRVNVRKGPSTDHAVAWVFSRIGLPVEVTAESGNWRRIRDSDSSEGWVFHSLLSGRRTALVLPWAEDGKTVSLFKDQSPSSGLVAHLKPGVLASVVKCDGRWCQISMDEYAGWIEQEKLWGVYGGEKVR